VLKVRLECVNITNFELPFIDDDGDQTYNEEQNKKFVVDCLAQFDVQQKRYQMYL